MTVSLVTDRWYGPLGSAVRLHRLKSVVSIEEGQVDPADDRFQDLPLYAPNHMAPGTGRFLGASSAADQAAESGKYRVRRGDVLYSKIRPALRKVMQAPEDGLCSADVYPLRARSEIVDQRFLLYVLLSDGFYRYSLLESARVAMPKINRDALGECPLPVPPREVQGAIVSFLDRKTTVIDGLIAKKERLVALLQEKRQALIAQAVTKGLDGSSMKPSGVDWFGDVPSHWEVVPVKTVARLESGHTPSRSVPEHWLETNDIPWVSLNDTKALAAHDYISETAYYINALGLQNSSARLLPARAVVFTRDATIGKAAITTRPMAVSQHLIAWVCGRRLLPEYLLRVFYAMEPALQRFTFGATLKTIGMDDVRELRTPLPTLDEQRRIVDHIVDCCGAIDAAVGAVRMQIDKLREYRQALITAAVTGQMDVTKEHAA